jgi:hypothetical protein
MQPSRITYRVSHSFRPNEDLAIELNWNARSDTYKAHVFRGIGNRESTLAKGKAFQLVQLVRELRLAAITSSHDGLDGTSYELTIGSVVAISYRWWEKLPDEWNELNAIVQILIELS